MDDDREFVVNVIKKRKVNGFEVSYALAMLGNVVLDVAHVLHP